MKSTQCIIARCLLWVCAEKNVFVQSPGFGNS